MGVDIARAGRRLPQLVEAFRVGNAPPALPWEPRGGQRQTGLVSSICWARTWLPAIVDVDILRAEPPARVADMACGTGWSSIAMAHAYPSITVNGVDVDEDAIAAARHNAEQAGVADRVTLSVGNASDLNLSGRYDLVTIFEALHDMSRPVDAPEPPGNCSARMGRCWWSTGLSTTSSAHLPPCGNGMSTAGAWSPACPTRWGPPDGRHRSRHAPVAATAVRPGGGLQRRGDPAHRHRLLALLPADS